MDDNSFHPNPNPHLVLRAAAGDPQGQIIFERSQEDVVFPPAPHFLRFSHIFEISNIFEFRSETRCQTHITKLDFG